MYLTKEAVWVDHIQKIEHHLARVLSDHVPLSMMVRLQPSDPSRRLESYFKFNYYELCNEEVLANVKAAWQNESLPLRDEGMKWSRGWIWVKQVLQNLRDDRDRRKKVDGALEQEVVWRRQQANEDSTVEELEMLAPVEKKLRDQNWLRHVDGVYTVGRTEVETGERTKAREKLVRLISRKLSFESSSRMSAVPDRKEIELVVFGLKSNKAHGFDGLTIEILQMCWEFVGDSCIRIVHMIWAKKKVLNADSVDTQQSNFVGGRQITDNILSLKLGQEWTKWWSQNALFVKLDFIKAYDRVDHKFLWRVLEEFGFDAEFIALVQGFTCAGTARVHLNSVKIIIYHGMMAIGLAKEDLKLERLCHEFLWGFTESGKLKKSLISWNRLIRPKKLGGLGFLSFESRMPEVTRQG
ncbi:hypothetical protein R1sor_022984 [Riccia sorocarpa]|uniref:Reverse transcriptase domain-containing protein n=1 Tax=Riccia sorocarpa TaxID=122646 RepID=A0ABD3GLE4_9MARC